MSSMFGKTYKKFFNVSSQSTPKLANVWGYDCDIYTPLYSTDDSHGNYDDVDIYSTHKNAEYSNTPDFSQKYYIVNLLKKQIMNSNSNEFETFYLDEESNRPFIECHVSQELLIQTKVVVHFDDDAKMNFFIEKKTSTPGGAFLRMYLNPLV